MEYSEQLFNALGMWKCLFTEDIPDPRSDNPGLIMKRQYHRQQKETKVHPDEDIAQVLSATTTPWTRTSAFSTRRRPFQIRTLRPCALPRSEQTTESPCTLLSEIGGIVTYHARYPISTSNHAPLYFFFWQHFLRCRNDTARTEDREEVSPLSILSPACQSAE
ncbi:hypothetical protein IV203_026104 [Nitzschia inconspicua]|uniref:Uncharacterized protein n=1 Tax=Nitzschia inconspicua TaxID=303405 RepID=A0A9K3PZJ7_9STRA|nr:hypothetical protein IV203_026104 [Nitzschia inconspicua]